MKKSYILVPLLMGILMVSVFSVPTVRAATIEELQAQIQQLLQMIMQLQSQLSQTIQAEPVNPIFPRSVVPTAKPAAYSCSWCGVSCQRISPWMYCPQIASPVGYDCREVNEVCTKVLSTTPVSIEPITSQIHVLSPNGEETFFPAKNNIISWSGGKGEVQVGIVDSNNVLKGWISLHATPNGKIT